VVVESLIDPCVSRTGFDGDLDSRIPSWGEEILRCHVDTSMTLAEVELRRPALLVAEVGPVPGKRLLKCGSAEFERVTARSTRSKSL
jgi:hypothetical protein